VIDGESEVGDCDEVMCARWGEPGGEWTRWGWHSLFASYLTVFQWCFAHKSHVWPVPAIAMKITTFDKIVIYGVKHCVPI